VAFDARDGERRAVHRPPKTRRQILTQLATYATIAAVPITLAAWLFPRSSSPDEQTPSRPINVTLDHQRLISGLTDFAKIEVSALEPRERFRVEYNGNPVGSDQQADETGAGCLPLQVDAETPVGNYTIDVRGLRSGRSGSTVVTIVKDPATFDGAGEGPWTGRAADVTIEVTRTRRYSNWTVVLDLTATNSSSSVADIRSGFSAEDARGKEYGVYVGPSKWPMSLGPGESVTGSITLNAAVHPDVTWLDVRFTHVRPDRDQDTVDLGRISVHRGTPPPVPSCS